MKRRTKIILILVAAVLLVLAVSIYETMPAALADILPDDNWTKAQMFLYRSNETQAIDLEGAKLEQLIAFLEETVVNQGTKFRTMSPPYIHIHLTEKNGPGTLIYLLEDGRIAVAVDYDTEKYQYFEGGEALYREILLLTANP